MTDRTPGYFRVVARALRPFPNFDFIFIKPVRARAVALLNLAPGDRVLDLGCGPGGSFPYLRNAVGGTGEVVGVEISSEVAANAERRVEVNGWDNVHVIRASAHDVVMNGQFDGALMFGAPDVFGDDDALANVFAHLKPGARVAFFGAKTSQRKSGWIMNGLLRGVFPRLSFSTTPVPDDEPWRAIASRLDRLEVHEYFFGWMFLACGTAR